MHIIYLCLNRFTHAHKCCSYALPFNTHPLLTSPLNHLTRLVGIQLLFMASAKQRLFIKALTFNVCCSQACCSTLVCKYLLGAFLCLCADTCMCVCVCASASAHVHLDVIDFQRCPVTVEPPHGLSWENERLSKRIPSSALLMFN